jgi:hypothetical protein
MSAHTCYVRKKKSGSTCGFKREITVPHYPEITSNTSMALCYHLVTLSLLVKVTASLSWMGCSSQCIYVKIA